MRLDPYLRPGREITLKWIIELNIRTKTVELLKENIGVNLHGLEQGGGF